MARKRIEKSLTPICSVPSCSDERADPRASLRLGLPAVTAQRKAERRKERALQWKRAVEEKARARIQAQASAEAPLKHMETLHSSLVAIMETTDGSAQASVRPLAVQGRKGALRAKARARVLAEERMRFAAVMKHPVFQHDPSAAVHGHLTHALQRERAD